MTSTELPFIDEDAVKTLISADDALVEMRKLFAQLSLGMATNFPVIREMVGNSVFGVKSGSHVERGLLGLKAGGYFPANALTGGTKHQSVVMLFDPTTGKPTALVAGNLITRLRTAAAAAVSIDLLSRPDAAVLAMIGAGAQAASHARAACAVRRFERIVVWNRSPEAARRLTQELATTGTIVEQSPSCEAAVRSADVIVTLTTATAPVVRAEWVRSGTHLACMGADTVGKQEMEEALVAKSRVFTDSMDQALSIGECQAGFRKNVFGRSHITGVLGDILTGRCEGRQDEKQITMFDGTGVAVQDLVMADLAARRMESGRAS